MITGKIRLYGDGVTSGDVTLPNLKDIVIEDLTLKAKYPGKH